MKWKLQFEEETGIAKKRETNEREGKKLTGRELFIRDKSLNESDLKFLEDGNETVFFLVVVIIVLKLIVFRGSC